MNTLPHSANPIKNTQTPTSTQMPLTLLQKTEELFAISFQTLQHYLVCNSGLTVIAVYELTSVSISAEALFIELVTSPRFVLGRKIILGPHLLTSMGKVTLTRKINTF